MAGEEARKNLYSYHENSNLVLASKRSKSRRNEPTGEAKSLKDHLTDTRMGDRAAREELKHNRSQNLDSTSKDYVLKKNVTFSDTALLSDKREVQTAGYVPRSSRTQGLYEELLYKLSVNYLQGQSHVVTTAAANEVIEILRNSEVSQATKKEELEELLATKSLPIDMYNSMDSICTQIDDYVVGAEVENAKFKSKLGGFGGQVLDMELEIDFDKIEEAENNELKVADDEMSVSSSKSDVEMKSLKQVTEEEASEVLSPRDIGAFWLQEQLSRLQMDKSEIHLLSDKVLEALILPSLKLVENRIVELLGIENFTLIQSLVDNRYLVHFTTKFKQASNAEAKSLLQESMLERGLSELWAQINEDGSNYGSRKERKKLDRTNENEKHVKNEIDFQDLKESFESKELMEEREIVLPDKTLQKRGKGYEEIHVPAVVAEKDPAEVLVKIENLPKYCHAAFNKIHSLNRIQSQVYPIAMARQNGYESHNMLVCAPTGAGKTNVGLMTILNEVFRFADAALETIDTAKLQKEMKIIYVAPMKALVQEVVDSYSRKLKAYGISVRELSGDISLTRREVEETQLIVATPEKLDVITRKNASRSLLSLADLVIFDEIHLLHNERGAVIESLVCRILLEGSLLRKTRILALSATLPNFRDVAAFLKVPKDGLFYFDNSYRPCPLKQVFIGVTEKKALKSINIQNKICYEKVSQQLKLQRRNQILVFVHSRNDTYKTAKLLIEQATEDGDLGMFVDLDDESTKELLKRETERKDSNKNLREVIKFGIGIHHAGLSRNDRNSVEELFLNRNIRVLISTATLAWGVNLPANNVIIKGTKVYNIKAGGYTELSFLDILQMLGRAGRPQFDTFGTGIIITSHDSLNTYLSLINEQYPIESKLIAELPNVLNAEIVKGTIRDIEEAVEWFRLTYLCVRMHKNPELYGVQHWDSRGSLEHAIQQHELRLIETALRVLSRAGLISYAKSGEIIFTDLGRIASYYYLSVETVAAYAEEIGKLNSDMDILRLFSLSSEFNNITVRSEEKIELKALADFLPIPLRDDPDEKTFKVACLLQCYISNHRLSSFSIKCDLIYIYMSAERIFRALFEVAIKAKRAIIACKCLDFAIMVSLRVWSCQFFIRELLVEQQRMSNLLQIETPTLGAKLVDKLERIGLRKEQYFALSKDEIIAMSNSEHSGRLLYRMMNSYPRFRISVGYSPISNHMLRLHIQVKPIFKYEDRFYGNKLVFWCFIEGENGHELLHVQRFVISKSLWKDAKEYEEDFVVKLAADILLKENELPRNLFVRIKSDKFSQCEATKPLNLGDLLMMKGSIKSTLLLNLQPSRVSTVVRDASVTIFEKMNFGDEFGLDALCGMFQELFSCTLKEGLDKSLRIFYKKENGKGGLLSPTLNQMIRPVLLDEGNLVICTPAITGKLELVQFSIIGFIMKLVKVKEQYQSIEIVKLACAGLKVIVIVNSTLFAQLLESRLRNDFSPLGIKISNFYSLEYFDPACMSFDWNIAILSPSMLLAIRRSNKDRLLLENLYSIVFENVMESCKRERGCEIYLTSLPKIAMSGRVICFASPMNNRDDIASVVQATQHFSFSRSTSASQMYLKGFSFLSRSEMLEQFSFYIRGVLRKHTPEEVIIFIPSYFQAFEIAKALIAEKGVQAKSSLKDLHEFGIGICDASQDQESVLTIFGDFLKGTISILFVTEEYWNEISVYASFVIICDDGNNVDHLKSAMDTCVDRKGPGSIHLLTSDRNIAVYEETYPLSVVMESTLHNKFEEYVLSLVVRGEAKDKQECIARLSETFFYRRLIKNPQYYGLMSRNSDDVSEFVSELLEKATAELERNKCISIEDNFRMSATMLGKQSYCLSIEPETMAFMLSCISASAKYKSILEVLSCAVEFNILFLRNKHYAELFKKLSYDENCCRLKISNIEFSSTALRVNVITQAFISKKKLPRHLLSIQRKVLRIMKKLLVGVQQVCLLKNLLQPCIVAAELMQMIKSRTWKSDSEILQIPGLEDKHIASLKAEGIESMEMFFNIDDTLRTKLLDIDAMEMKTIASFCNQIPDLEAEVDRQKSKSDDTLWINVRNNGYEVVEVPSKRSTFCEIIVGDGSTDTLVGYSRFTFTSEQHLIPVKLYSLKGSEVMIYIVCEEFRGVDIMLKYKF